MSLLGLIEMRGIGLCTIITFPSRLTRSFPVEAWLDSWEQDIFWSDCG